MGEILFSCRNCEIITLRKSDQIVAVIPNIDSERFLYLTVRIVDETCPNIDLDGGTLEADEIDQL